MIKKNGMYLGKGYVKEGLLKMNVMTVPPKVVAPIVSMNKKPIAYLVEFCNIWHERLGHVNYKSIQRLMNLNIIPKCKTSKQNVKYAYMLSSQKCYHLVLKELTNL